jgi:hypothetical protein
LTLFPPIKNWHWKIFDRQLHGWFRKTTLAYGNTKQTTVNEVVHVMVISHFMKTCANCSAQNPDDATNCQSCSTCTFISSSPEAIGGHIISVAEARFWERMTFRQFAILIVRIQALWFLVNALLDATYLPRYWPIAGFGESFATMSGARKLELFLMILRFLLNVAAGISCIQFADRIISWLVKDTIPKQPLNIAREPTTATSDTTKQ